MTVLIITAIVTAIFALMANGQYKRATSGSIISANEKPSLSSYYLFVIVCAVILASVSGLRYNVGTDFGGYYKFFDRWATELPNRIQSWDEPGISIIANILYRFTDNGAYFIFATASITVTLFVITLSKHTDDFFFVVMLYIFIAWTGCFNAVRQYMAAAVFFAGHRLLYERKFIKYCILVFAAASFHISALVLLPLYFIVTKTLNFRKIILIITAGIALVFSYDFLFNLSDIMKNEELEGATTQYAQNEIHPLRIAIALAPLIVYFFLKFQNKTFTDEENIYMSMMIINFALIFATANSAYLNRITIYFKAFIPLALCFLCNKFDSKQRSFIKVIVLILYAIVWVYIDTLGVKWYWSFDH